MPCTRRAVASHCAVQLAKSPGVIRAAVDSTSPTSASPVAAEPSSRRAWKSNCGSSKMTCIAASLVEPHHLRVQHRGKPGPALEAMLPALDGSGDPRSTIPNDMDDDLCFTPAAELARLLRNGNLSARELLDAFLNRIHRINPQLNAIVTLAEEQATAAATAADDAAAHGESRGVLHGLPIAVKDLADTAGIRTTYGSPLFADHVPDTDAPHVALLKAAGAVIIGKTNTPEFGAGSQTFNPVFGVTRNPWDTRMTPGGSSGGAAAAVAAGLLPFADGSDLAASVRNPAAMCSLVGLRTTPGTIPSGGDFFNPLPVLGPVARSA